MTAPIEGLPGTNSRPKPNKACWGACALGTVCRLGADCGNTHGSVGLGYKGCPSRPIRCSVRLLPGPFLTSAIQD